MPVNDAIRQRIRERLQEQRRLVSELLGLREQLQGSLIVRYAVCGKETCACRSGVRHGPYYVLSNRSGGKGGFTYLDGPRAAEARQLVGRYRRFKDGLKRLKRVNTELVTLLRRYQTAMTRQAGRRLGVAARPS